MNQDFWKKRLIQRYKFLEYDGNALVQIHWRAVANYVNGVLDIDEALMCAFWDILNDEAVMSFDWEGKFGLFNDDTMMFCGPRSGNSGAPLFFVNVKDAREYKMAFFLARNTLTAAVVEMRNAG